MEDMTELFEWLWSALDEDKELEVGQAKPKIIKKLNSLNFPKNYIQILSEVWPQEDGQLSYFNINSSKEVLEGFSSVVMTQLGYLEIGSAGNGDPLVINFKHNEAVGFINHETLNFDGTDKEADFEPIAPDLITFMEDLIKGAFIPIDYWVARDYNAYKILKKNRHKNYQKLVQQIHEKRKA